MTPGPMIVFALDERRFALPLGAVERAVRMVEVLPLPKAPEIVCGVVNVHGRIIPVIDARRRFGLPEKAVALSDQLLIASTRTLTLAMRVDAVIDVVEWSEEDCIAAEGIVAGLEHVAGIAKLAGGMVLIHDLESFLSLEEERSLGRALAAALVE